MATTAAKTGTEAKNSFSLVGDEKLRQIYATMLRCRVIQEHVDSQGKQSRLTGCSSVGQEATRVGVAINLRHDDIIAPSHNYLIDTLIRGVPLATIVEETDKALKPSASARRFKMATDAARGQKQLLNGAVVVVFSDGMPTANSGWDRAIEFAGVHRLPMLFVEQRDGNKSNGKRRSVPVDANVLPVIPVDCNDAVAVYRVAFESIKRARQGGGPTLIECKPYLFDDPIEAMEKYLSAKHLFSAKWKRRLLDEVELELHNVNTLPPN